MEIVEKNIPQTLNTIKILIADDDPPTRMLLRAAISQWGYETVEAGDGEQAWQQLQEVNPPEIIILDWIMPKLDGPGLCERIKEEMPHRPYIILLTQVTGTTNIIKGLEAGADEFLSKPFNMAELRSRLSVGRRIVNYKHELAKQNQQIAEYTIQTDKITQLAQETMQQITDINNIENENKEKNLTANYTKKLAELKNNVDKLIKLSVADIFKK